jgi:hypothetical protein
MDLGEHAHRVKFMIRDRGSNFTAAFDAVLADAGIRTVLCNVRTPRMNAIAERWIGGCRRELLDRTLIWNQAHLRRILRAYEIHHNQHRPHRSLNSAAPLKPLPEPVDLGRYHVRRQAHTGCLINEYRLVALRGRGFRHAHRSRRCGCTSPVSVHTTSFSQRYRSSPGMGNAASELAHFTRGGPRVSVPCEEHRGAAGCLKDAAKVWQEGVAGPPPRVARAAEAPRQVPLGDQEALPLCPGRAGQLRTPRPGAW